MLEDLNNDISDVNATVAEYNGMQQLIDDIYELNSKSDKTQEDLNEINAKAEILRQNGIDIEVDSSGVVTARDEVEKLIDAQYRQAMMESVSKALSDAYLDMYNSSKNYEDALNELNSANEKMADLEDTVKGYLREHESQLFGLIGVTDDGTVSFDDLSLSMEDMISYMGDLDGNIDGLQSQYDDLTTNINDAKTAMTDSTNTYNTASTTYSRMSDLFNDLGDSSKSMSDIIGDSTDYMGKMFDTMSNSADGAASSIGQSTSNMVSGVGNQNSSLKTEFQKLVNSGTDGALLGFNAMNNDLFSASKKAAEKGIEGYQEGQDSHSPSKKYYNLALDAIQGYVNGINSRYTVLTKAMQNLAKKGITAFKNELKSNSNGIDTFCDDLASAINNNAYKVTGAFRSMLNAMIDVMNGFMSNCESGLNSLMSAFANTMNSASVSGNKASYKLTGVGSIAKLASGGIIPSSGQVFMSRENGIPELVGAYGNQTAVMNNDQIVTAVSNGVYNAVVSAMSNSDGNAQNITITLDGEVIYRNQEKIKRNKGYNLGLGAFSFG